MFLKKLSARMKIGYIGYLSKRAFLKLKKCTNISFRGGGPYKRTILKMRFKQGVIYLQLHLLRQKCRQRDSTPAADYNDLDISSM